MQCVNYVLHMSKHFCWSHNFSILEYKYWKIHTNVDKGLTMYVSYVDISWHFPNHVCMSFCPPFNGCCGWSQALITSVVYTMKAIKTSTLNPLNYFYIFVVKCLCRKVVTWKDADAFIPPFHSFYILSLMLRMQWRGEDNRLLIFL